MTEVTVTSTPYEVSVSNDGSLITVASTGPAGPPGSGSGSEFTPVADSGSGSSVSSTLSVVGGTNITTSVSGTVVTVNSPVKNHATIEPSTDAGVQFLEGTTEANDTQEFINATGLADYLSQRASNLSDLANVGTARTNLELGTAAILATGIEENNVPKFASGVADDDFLRVIGAAVEGRSAAQVLTDIGASPLVGSDSITTVGTINSGTWGGTAIEYSALGSKPVLGTAAALDVGTDSLNVVQLSGVGAMPAVSGSALTGLNAGNFTSGTLAVARGGTGLTSISTLLNSNQAYGDISDTPTLGNVAGLAVGISENNVLQANAAVSDNDFLTINGTKVEGRSAAETLIDIGASPTAGNTSLVTTGTIGTGTWNATAILDTKIDLRVDHGVTFDGQGSVIESGKAVLVPVERAGVIKAATLVGDASGAITITITKYDPAADATTLGSAAAVGSIALATKIINRDTTLSGWTLAVAEGDVLAFTTGGTIATVTRVTCKLKVELA